MSVDVPEEAASLVRIPWSNQSSIVPRYSLNQEEFDVPTPPHNQTMENQHHLFEIDGNPASPPKQKVSTPPFLFVLVLVLVYVLLGAVLFIFLEGFNAYFPYYIGAGVVGVVLYVIVYWKTYWKTTKSKQ